VVEHLVARGDAPRALTLLRRPGTPRELTYKFAPALMAAAPDAAVDAWLQAQPPLDPRCAAAGPCCDRERTTALSHTPPRVQLCTSRQLPTIRHLHNCHDCVMTHHLPLRSPESV
jgi:hypothetical protein